MDLYETMTRVEQERCAEDRLIHLLLHDDLTDLNQEVDRILQHVCDTHDLSARFKSVMAHIRASDDRSVKHALVMFALFNDAAYREAWVNDAQVNVLKFQHFYELSLKPQTQNLLLGRMLCLQDYVETIRLEYIVT